MAEVDVDYCRQGKMVSVEDEVVEELGCWDEG